MKLDACSLRDLHNLILQSNSAKEVAKSLGVHPQTLRKFLAKFNLTFYSLKKISPGYMQKINPSYGCPFIDQDKNLFLSFPISEIEKAKLAREKTRFEDNQFIKGKLAGMRTARLESLKRTNFPEKAADYMRGYNEGYLLLTNKLAGEQVVFNRGENREIQAARLKNARQMNFPSKGAALVKVYKNSSDPSCSLAVQQTINEGFNYQNQLMHASVDFEENRQESFGHYTNCIDNNESLHTLNCNETPPYSKEFWSDHSVLNSLNDESEFLNNSFSNSLEAEFFPMPAINATPQFALPNTNSVSGANERLLPPIDYNVLPQAGIHAPINEEGEMEVEIGDEKTAHRLAQGIRFKINARFTKKIQVCSCNKKIILRILEGSDQKAKEKFYNKIFLPAITQRTYGLNDYRFLANFAITTTGGFLCKDIGDRNNRSSIIAKIKKNPQLKNNIWVNRKKKDLIFTIHHGSIAEKEHFYKEIFMPIMLGYEKLSLENSRLPSPRPSCSLDTPTVQITSLCAPVLNGSEGEKYREEAASAAGDLAVSSAESYHLPTKERPSLSHNLINKNTFFQSQKNLSSFSKLENPKQIRPH